MANLIKGMYSRHLWRLTLQLPNSRTIFTTSTVKGLEEFFPPGVYEEGKYVEEQPISGRKWKASELRIKSNSDLHKFWYVLLKEKNMLLTLDQECKRQGVPVPGPTRLHKVNQTMWVVMRVIEERQKSILELEKERSYSFDEDSNVENNQ